MALAVGLMGSRCGEAEALTPEVLREDVAPPFEYGLYSDAQGRLEGETAGVLLVHRGEHLERVYADAQRGEPRARVLFGQLEQVSEASGEGLADQAMSLACSALPTCTVKWARLEELIPSTGPGGVRLRQALVHGFQVQARRKHVENAVITAGMNALVVGGAAMAVEAAATSAEVKAGAGEARQLAGEATAQAGSALAGVEGRLANQEAEALEARFAEAEAQEEGGRQSARLEDLARLRPVLRKPPPGVAATHQAWGDDVAYWERRYEELAGERQRPAWLAPAKPPLEWPGYALFRGRFRRALEFQGQVTRTLRQQAGLAEGSRAWLRGMAQPRVEENVGLAHESTATLTYVDQFVVDEASLRPGSTPVVHSFSNKQRNFNGMDEQQITKNVAVDVQEALSKYGGAVEVRRPGHPLLGQKIVVSKVHLVYDESMTSPATKAVIEKAARSARIELHFHGK